MVVVAAAAAGVAVAVAVAAVAVAAVAVAVAAVAVMAVMIVAGVCVWGVVSVMQARAGLHLKHLDHLACGGAPADQTSTPFPRQHRQLPRAATDEFASR